MTFRLAAELSERFSAVGMVAGLMMMEHPKPAKPLPTLFIVGTKDPLVPIDGGEVKLPWGSHHNPPVADRLAVWAGGDGLQTQPKILSNQDAVERLVYPSKSGGPTLSVIYLDGHGHHWPGGVRTLPESMVGPITTKLDATDTLWDFFRAAVSR